MSFRIMTDEGFFLWRGSGCYDILLCKGIPSNLSSYGLAPYQEPHDPMLNEMVAKDEVKNKLLQLYAVNEPSKLPYIDALMEMYEGREGELLHAAEKKYVA